MSSPKYTGTPADMVKRLREMSAQFLSPNSWGKMFFEAVANELECRCHGKTAVVMVNNHTVCVEEDVAREIERLRNAVHSVRSAIDRLPE